MTDKRSSLTPDSSRLLVDGRPFFAVIVNYVGHADRAWSQFVDSGYDPALIEADFRLICAAGANAVRTFVAAPLQNEFTKGNWTKLDGLVAAACSAGIRLILTFADYGLSYVNTLGAHAGLIAAHFAGNPTILAYDLKNEPRFYHLALMHYPAANPLYARELTAAHPPVRTPEDALAWARQEGKAPNWMSDSNAIHYANVSEVLDEFLRASGQWISSKGYRVSVVDFIRSPEAYSWQAFIRTLNAALEAWLAPQVRSVRAADPGRPITVGYSDPLLAALPANSILDLHAINRYPRDASPRQLEYQLDIARGLRETFPGRPVIWSEFGYPTSEQEPAQAASCESAAWLSAYKAGLAGAGKWMLWDLPPGPNPRERSFGLYEATGAPKPSALALPAIGAHLGGGRAPCGSLEITTDASGGVTYDYRADDALFAGGQGRAGDDAVCWEGQGLGQVLATWSEPGVIRVRTTAPGQVTLDLGRMLGLGLLGSYDLSADGRPLPHTQAGVTVRFDAEAGQEIVLRMRLELIDAKIAILWPHGSAPVAEARMANLTAYLTHPDSRVVVPCHVHPPVTLWRAVDNEPGQPIAVGVRRWADIDGRTVPCWDFNDVDVSPARDPATKLHFRLEIAGHPYRSNVWVHGVDARTFMPSQVEATACEVVAGDSPPSELDARIQIVWPHDGAPVGSAERANITVDLFRRGTLVGLLPDGAGKQPWAPRVWLFAALNNEPGQRVALGSSRTRDGAAHWDFNDVDVSPARDPAVRLHFWVEVEGIRTYSSFWTHGADARTHLPNPDIPLGDCPQQ